MQARQNLPFIERNIGYNWGSGCWPQGIWGSGDNGYLFSGSWEALVNINRDLWSNLIVRWIWEALQKVKNKCKKSHLKEKTYISFDFFLYIDGSYRSNAIVNTEYPKSKNSDSL